MAFGFCIGVALLLSLWSRAETAGIPDGVLRMDCHDRYFMMAVDPSFTGDEPHFEAVGETGAYAITQQYAAQCGYSINVLPLPGHVELRASYFSCQTQNKDDEMFTFNFNLNVTQEGKEVTYPLNKTCFPSLPWSPREVTCETNYMEVSVRSEVTCPSGTKKDDWNSLKPAHRSTTSDWQVMFQTADEQLPPMNISDARKRGYVFLLTEGRLVFRAPYGQPESFSTELNGVPVEAVHATIFSRQSWIVLLVDLVAACSMDEGLYHESGYMMWETPEMLYPNLDGQQVNVGLKGEVVAQPVAEERGYIVGKQNNTIQICIPENAEGRYRKSAVDDDLYEFYVYHLYLEQILVDEDRVETRIRFLRTLATPLLPSPIFAENQTVLEENMFTVYLGDVPEDVQLAAVHLNGQEFTVPLNVSSFIITKVVHPNNTHGYKLKVPFEDPVVLQQLSKTAAVHYILNINYTLTVLPENDLYYRMESVVALVTGAPPQFDAVCTESGISFKLDHQPFDYLWEITIESDLLTSELADQHGYIMSNDSNSLLLEVPLFSHGYEYKNISLKGFFGTFEIIMRDLETSEVQGSTIKTCPFSTTELITCSTDGTMTVVADLALAIPNGGNPARTNLRDKYCGPKETDGSRALFSFSLNSCGSAVKLNSENVTYQNEIFYSKKFLKVVSDNAAERVTMQCTYPLSGLHRLFSVHRFESDAAGIGSLLHTTHPAAGLQSPTIQPTSALTTTLATTTLATTTLAATRQATASYKPAFHPPARYVKVTRFRYPTNARFRYLANAMSKGVRQPLQKKN
ncbi:zona pellucida protein AX 4 [Trematomus bernacchii]|uniref:zona pellucida protein AX 4 n=1 Tax=Trematomus bernacchii TaxID=40690 RepID=UPI00146E2580|nr:zona pellucida protein AX 4 [Trematomus bernacchii]